MSRQAIVTIKDREWVVDIASLPWELSQGLGGISEMPVGTGMLFDTGFEQKIEVTSVPMLFSLDIAFISPDLIVTEVRRNVAPGYLVTSMTPARYFLEVNAGELGDIDTGDEVWKFYSGDSQGETIMGSYPMWQGPLLADGVVYAGMGEETPTQPLHRGGQVFAIDEETGEEIWSIAGWMLCGQSQTATS